jgi:hypothetical protein
MGAIRIETFGSFLPQGKLFRAQDSGHAIAVQDAINWLRGDVLPDAIKQDRQLRAQGKAPDDGFKAYDKACEAGELEAPTSMELP